MGVFSDLSIEQMEQEDDSEFELEAHLHHVIVEAADICSADDYYLNLFMKECFKRRGHGHN